MEFWGWVIAGLLAFWWFRHRAAKAREAAEQKQKQRDMLLRASRTYREPSTWDGDALPPPAEAREPAGEHQQQSDPPLHVPPSLPDPHQEVSAQAPPAKVREAAEPKQQSIPLRVSRMSMPTEISPEVGVNPSGWTRRVQKTDHAGRARRGSHGTAPDLQHRVQAPGRPGVPGGVRNAPPPVTSPRCRGAGGGRRRTNPQLRAIHPFGWQSRRPCWQCKTAGR